MDPPLTAAASFEKDDLEFRTITTLLHILGSSGRITLDNFEVPPRYRRQLKLLVALSSLLVREHEIVAVMAKRNVSGTTFVLGSNSTEETDATGLDVPGGEPTCSTSSSDTVMSDCSHHNLLTQNPRFGSPTGPVQLLLEGLKIEIGPDVFEFILQHWDQSFESHVRAFTSLLNNALQDPYDLHAICALEMYSFFQSAPKIYRRFTMSKNLAGLALLQPQFPTTLSPVPSEEERVKIDAILATNAGGALLHPTLYSFVSDPPEVNGRWLPEFHRFFVWFLGIFGQQIEQLGVLRGTKGKNQPAPLALPKSFIDQAFNNLEGLRFFAWDSPFFVAYIATLLSSISQGTSVAAEGASTEVGGTEVGRPELGLDISTEFETGEEQSSARAPAPVIDPIIQELRLISSNLEQLNRLQVHSPKSRFRFQIIQYPPSGQSLKPWRELIHELFPHRSGAGKIIAALLAEPGYKFKPLRKPVLRFAGQAHCEAVLACLYSLSKSDADISWTGISDSVLNTIRTCYSLLAPSKRCCPVCATTVSLLSAEAKNTSGSSIHALSKHSIIYPCALPIGLPRSIREKLLVHYRGELRVRLAPLVDKNRRESSTSVQSNALSVDKQKQNTSKAKQMLMRQYQNNWENLGPVERIERWQKARNNLSPEMLEGWWFSMGPDQRVGLVPPESGNSAGDGSRR